MIAGNIQSVINEQQQGHEESTNNSFNIRKYEHFRRYITQSLEQLKRLESERQET